MDGDWIFEQPVVDNIQLQTRDYCNNNGINYATIMAPHSILPERIPRNCVENAKKVGPLFSKLVANISRDISFIAETSKCVNDCFTEKLLNICLEVEKLGGDPQPIQMGIYRSDYMLHQQDKLLQVELNTISVSFIALGQNIIDMHRFLIERGYIPGANAENCPNSNQINSFCNIMGKANQLYNKEGSAVVMVVEESERNTSDQRQLEYHLWRSYKIPLLRKTLAQIEKEATVDDEKNITMDGKPIALFYLRTGYAPDQYKSEIEWNARLKIESSTSIVVPNIRYHLCGTKKMQQVWSLEGVIERYLSPEESIFMRQFFAGQYSLDAKDHPEEIIAKVKLNPDKYVMKPQREGGGNLYYGEQMIHGLDSFTDQERSAYIIMDLIEPPTTQTYFHGILPKTTTEFLELHTGISELGTYEFYLEDKSTGEVHINESGGTLVRMKRSDAKEGGVGAGLGFLSSVYLS